MTNVNLNDCKELTAQEYCDLSKEIELSFEGQTRASSHGVYWIVWSNNEELYKVKCSLNYFENNQASSQEEYDSNEEYYEQNLIIT